MNRSRYPLVALAAFLLCSGPAFCSVTAGTSLFTRGRVRFSGYAGAASALDQTYTLIGVGAGYFLTNGLEMGIDGEAWVGNDPNIYKLTPQLRYVFYRLNPRLFPYIGAFYRRTMYESLTDLDSYGGRAGIYTQLGGRAYAGVGIVAEKLVECDDRIYSSCSSTYPEFSISVGF